MLCAPSSWANTQKVSLLPRHPVCVYGGEGHVTMCSTMHHTIRGRALGHSRTVAASQHASPAQRLARVRVLQSQAPCNRGVSECCNHKRMPAPGMKPSQTLILNLLSDHINIAYPGLLEGSHERCLGLGHGYYQKVGSFFCFFFFSTRDKSSERSTLACIATVFSTLRHLHLPKNKYKNYYL